MTDDEIQRATTFLEKFKTLGISEHIVSVAERGDQENHLHLQSMISGEWCTRKCNTAEMKKVVNMEKIFSRSYNCAVVVHKLDENRSMESICGCDACVILNVVTLTRVIFKWFKKGSQDSYLVKSVHFCRYTLKNKELNQDVWGVMYVCGGCEEDDFIERAFRAHNLASKKQIFVGKIPIKPTNAARHVVQFTAKQLRSISMHPAQYVRLMSNSGHYVLAPEMAASGAFQTCMITNLQPVMTIVYLHVCVMTALTLCICVNVTHSFLLCVNC
jgi:hypothetical protein